MNEVLTRADVYRDVAEKPENVAARSAITDELGLAEVLQKLWRQKLWILGTIFVVTFFSWVGISQLTPLYTAVSQVMIGVPDENVLDVEDVLTGLTSDGVAVENEVQSSIPVNSSARPSMSWGWCTIRNSTRL